MLDLSVQDPYSIKKQNHIEYFSPIMYHSSVKSVLNVLQKNKKQYEKKLKTRLVTNKIGGRVH